MSEVVVVGSANVDLVLTTERIPRPGETVLASGLTRGAGGKGANQAVASARAGASTVFVAALGDDDGGVLLRDVLGDSGVDLSLLQTGTAPTGTAVITVDGAGENAITVAPSANAELTLTPAARAAVTGAKVVLAQLEIPLGVVRAAAEASAYFVLNAAPATELPDALPRQVDLLVVNETEAEAIAGPRASALLDLVPAAVVTLGARGSVVLARGADEVRVPAVPAEVVDTTGAGDTFCGYLAATLARAGTTPHDLTNAVRRATVAASLSVRAMGATASVPTGDTVDARCAEVAL